MRGLRTRCLFWAIAAVCTHLLALTGVNELCATLMRAMAGPGVWVQSYFRGRVAGSPDGACPHPPAAPTDFDSVVSGKKAALVE